MIQITSGTSTEEFFGEIIPRAYQAELHLIPAKYSNDMPLLLHAMTATLVSGLLIEYLSRQSDRTRQLLSRAKEEIWLATFLHDILKEATWQGDMVNHQDVRPDDIESWLTKLGIHLRNTNALNISARIALHERIGLPLFSAFADIEQDDLPQLIIRLSDQMASLSAINEHWTYPGHGLPRIAETLNGNGRSKGINERLLHLGVREPLSLFTHYHTRLNYPCLINHLMAGTIASIGEYGLEPILVMAEGTIYIGTQSQCANIKHKAADLSETGLATQVLNKTWERVQETIARYPLRPEDIQSTKNGMKIYAQMRLLGTHLAGDQGLFDIISTYLSQRVETKTFKQKPLHQRAAEVEKFIVNTLKLIERMPSYYAALLQFGENKIPVLNIGGEPVTFANLAERSNYPPSYLRSQISRLSDPGKIAVELHDFGQSIVQLVDRANTEEFEIEIQSYMRRSYESALRSLIDGNIIVDESALKLPAPGKKSGEKFCPVCGQMAFKTKEASTAVVKQRETFYPITVRSHTNSITGAESDGTRVFCQVCALEMGLRGMALDIESYRNKQSILYIHFLPFYSFPMNWMDAIKAQFGFRRELPRFNEANIKLLFQALFGDDTQSNWEWIEKIAKPMRLIDEAFFSEEEDGRERDEFFGTPLSDTSGSVTLSLYVRRTEKKSNKKDPEDEIGRKEIWTRGLLFASIFALTLPARIALSESPLINFDPLALKSSLTLINPPSAVSALLSRIRSHTKIRTRFQPSDSEVSHLELWNLIKLLVYAIRVNKTLGGVIIGKDGREYAQRPSRRAVEILQALAEETLPGSWLHQRDWQSRSEKFRPKWLDPDYQIFTKACKEVDQMLNPEESDRLRELAQITQTFYSPPVYDSSYALTLLFKIATKNLQRFNSTGVTEAELKSIMRSDIESSVRRQSEGDSSRAWSVLKRAKVSRAEKELTLSDGVRQFTDAFFRDIVHGICGDIANFLLLRKRLQSGYLIQMKDLAMETWQREGWRMFRQQKAAEIGQENTNDFSIPV